MTAAKRFNNQFVAKMQQIVEFQAKGLRRDEISKIMGISTSRVSRGSRIYLTSLGKTADARNLDVRQKAVELVKLLDEDEISLSKAEDELVAVIKQYNGRAVARRTVTVLDPEQQLAGYKRAVSNLEGICYALDRMPDVVHTGIEKAQREEIQTRLAGCRRIIERRINILRKDENAEAHNQEG